MGSGRLEEIVSRYLESRRRANIAPAQSNFVEHRFERPRISEAPSDYLTVRYDLLRWLVQKRLIEPVHFHVGRTFQQLYLRSLIQPPRCALEMGGFGRGTKTHNGYARADIPFPEEGTFIALKELAEIGKKLRPSSYRALRNILCQYGIEERELGHLRSLIHKNPIRMKGLLKELAWAMSWTTENPYDDSEKPSPHPDDDDDGLCLAVNMRPQFGFRVSRRDKRKRQGRQNV